MCVIKNTYVEKGSWNRFILNMNGNKPRNSETNAFKLNPRNVEPESRFIGT